MTFILKDGTPRTVDAPLGLSVMEIAVKNTIDPIEGACGGSLACATCHVYIHPDWLGKVTADDEKSEEEEDMLDLAFDVRKNSAASAARSRCVMISTAWLWPYRERNRAGKFFSLRHALLDRGSAAPTPQNRQTIHNRPTY